MKKARKGFTLVELLIVISILGVLAASMSMATKDSTGKAKASKIVSDLRTIGSAVQVYMMDSKDEGPLVSYFNNHSDDYIFNGTIGQYKVTSTDKNLKGWYVEFKGTIAATTASALKDLSADVGLIGKAKLRIN